MDFQTTWWWPYNLAKTCSSVVNIQTYNTERLCYSVLVLDNWFNEQNRIMIPKLTIHCFTIYTSEIFLCKMGCDFLPMCLIPVPFTLHTSRLVRIVGFTWKYIWTSLHFRSPHLQALYSTCTHVTLQPHLYEVGVTTVSVNLEYSN